MNREETDKVEVAKQRAEKAEAELATEQDKCAAALSDVGYLNGDRDKLIAELATEKRTSSEWKQSCAAWAKDNSAMVLRLERAESELAKGFSVMTGRVLSLRHKISEAEAELARVPARERSAYVAGHEDESMSRTVVGDNGCYDRWRKAATIRYPDAPDAEQAIAEPLTTTGTVKKTMADLNDASPVAMTIGLDQPEIAAVSTTQCISAKAVCSALHLRTAFVAGMKAEQMDPGNSVARMVAESRERYPDVPDIVTKAMYGGHLGTESIPAKPYPIGSIGPGGGYVFTEGMEAAPNDEPEKMTWKAAVAKYKGRADGWRLPTKAELNLMYENLHKRGLGRFSGAWYWFSSQYSYGDAWGQYFGDGSRGDYSVTDATSSVRAVRGFNASTKPAPCNHEWSDKLASTSFLQRCSKCNQVRYKDETPSNSITDLPALEEEDILKGLFTPTHWANDSLRTLAERIKAQMRREIMTTSLDKHPEGYDGPCWCYECRGNG